MGSVWTCLILGGITFHLSDGGTRFVGSIAGSGSPFAARSQR